MSPYPLIVSNTEDLHADALVAELVKRNCGHYRLNTNLMGLNGDLNWSLNSCEFVEYGRQLDVRKVTCVVWRRPEHSTSNNLSELPAETVAAVEEEGLLAVQGVLRAAFDRCPLWISHPDNIRKAQFKPRQLSDAKALGLTVPDTLVTNDPDRARKFIRSHNYRVAAKQAARGRKINQFDGAVYSVNLSRYTPEHVDSLLETVRYCPVMFQEYIEKKYEVRSTFFGARSLSAKIMSQEHEAAQDDWRRFYSEHGLGLRHEPAELPESILVKCRAMLAQYGLNFGCFDFIVTPKSEFVFLELNPNGQFLWLEYEVPDFPLVNAWADLVTGVGKSISM